MEHLLVRQEGYIVRSGTHCNRHIVLIRGRCANHQDVRIGRASRRSLVLVNAAEKANVPNGK
jgi:hypothetical protein